MGPMQNYQMNNYMNPYMQMAQRFVPQNNLIIWVQGLEGAKAYQLSPNSNVVLMDSDNDGIFYIKVSDNVGMCTLRTFKYTEITEAPKVTEPQSVDLTNYVTHGELESVIAELKGVLTNGKQSVPATNEPKPLI